MGYRENSRTIRGTNGIVATSTTGVIQTNNYDVGGSFAVNPNEGDTYPTTFDPAGFTIQFLKVLETGTAIRMDITTKTGDQIEDVQLRGAAFEEESIEMDSVTFKDPDGTGAPTFGYYSGE
ncbi:hypothetical protein [Halorussus litoreus]|uniref:hypothetical protein n=1 Tax=Halorussus litoreus TaxID=1710536 RepID=UPI000E26010A|nr:hypothetical protein [Halorussus litoreus]